MSQISPPIRILLVAAVLFAAAWMLVLRPKNDAGAPAKPAASTPTAPGVKGLTNAVAKAQGAKAAQESRDAKVQAATGGAPAASAQGATAAKPGTAAQAVQAAPVAIPAAVLAKLPARVSGALKAHKLLVLGVVNTDHKPWRLMSDDDRLVRDALKGVNRYKGDVVVQTVPLAGLSRYGALVGDLDVSQSPAVVIVDRTLKATRLDGFVDRAAIDQAIADARRATTKPLISNPWLKKANKLCADYHLRMAGVDRADRGTVTREYRHAAARLHAPARFKRLQGQLAASFSHPGAYDARFNSVGLTSCALDRTQ